MALFILFICGVINFACHKATMDSDHPVMEQTRKSMQKFAGGRGSYILEFVILLSAMGFAEMGSAIAVPAYGIYTAINGLAAYLILSGKM